MVPIISKSVNNGAKTIFTASSSMTLKILLPLHNFKFDPFLSSNENWLRKLYSTKHRQMKIANKFTVAPLFMFQKDWRGCCLYRFQRFNKLRQMAQFSVTVPLFFSDWTLTCHFFVRHTLSEMENFKFQFYVANWRQLPTKSSHKEQ